MTNEQKAKIEKEFDEKIGYCTKSECVNLNDIKDFIFQTIDELLADKIKKVEELKMDRYWVGQVFNINDKTSWAEIEHLTYNKAIDEILKILK